MTPVLAAAHSDGGREQVWVSEGFYGRCYRVAIGGTLAMCAVAIVLAYVDGLPHRPATIALSSLLAAAALAAGGRRGYEWLRAHPTALALTGPLAVASAVWPAVDENALYFPVLGPLAIVACVASNRRQAFTVIASLAAGTFLAALLDYRDPTIANPDQLATATIGVLISGTMFVAIADWCAVWVLEEAHDAKRALEEVPAGTRPETEAPPPTEAPPSAGALPEVEAATMARWMLAIKSWIVTPLRRGRGLWVELTGFRGRQLQILILLGGGLDDREIGSFLSLATSTVERYVGEALKHHNRRRAERLTVARPALEDNPDKLSPDERHTVEDIVDNLHSLYGDMRGLERLLHKYRERLRKDDPEDCPGSPP